MCVFVFVFRNDSIVSFSFLTHLFRRKYRNLIGLRIRTWAAIFVMFHVLKKKNKKMGKSFLFVEMIDFFPFFRDRN